MRPGAHLPREYRQVLTSNDKGNIAEAAIALEAIKLGIDVLKPIAEHGRYDLAFDLGHRIAQGAVQMGERSTQETVRVHLTSTWYTSQGKQVRTRYAADEVDCVAAYCQELGTCYLLPTQVFAGQILRESAGRSTAKHQSAPA